MIYTFDKRSAKRIVAATRSVERAAESARRTRYFPRGLVWSGRIRVGGKLWTVDDITGTSIFRGLVKVFFDAVTPPAWATQAEYDADPWPSDYIIVRLSDVQGDYILPRG